jgi:hemoglobin
MNGSASGVARDTLPDLDSPARIDRFVDLFYQRLLADPQLAPLFIDVAAIDLEVHLPHIRAYWRKLLLGDREYRRHTMNIHRQLHRKQALRPADFQRWLLLFTTTVKAHFRGPLADRACRIAATIAANMEAALRQT